MPVYTFSMVTTCSQIDCTQLMHKGQVGVVVVVDREDKHAHHAAATHVDASGMRSPATIPKAASRWSQT